MTGPPRRARVTRGGVATVPEEAAAKTGAATPENAERHVDQPNGFITVGEDVLGFTAR